MERNGELLFFTIYLKYPLSFSVHCHHHWRVQILIFLRGKWWLCSKQIVNPSLLGRLEAVGEGIQTSWFPDERRHVNCLVVLRFFLFLRCAWHRLCGSPVAWLRS